LAGVVDPGGAAVEGLGEAALVSAGVAVAEPAAGHAIALR
jgi:hypothetical protein